METPSDVLERLQSHCIASGRTSGDRIGGGVDGFIWLSDRDSVIKVYRGRRPFERELAIYKRLVQRDLRRLRGFEIPELKEVDADNLVLVLGVVEPPFLIDFGAAVLDERPAEFRLDSEDWKAEKRRVYGDVDWPEIERLLESLVQYGVYYTDVHPGNVRVRRDMPSRRSSPGASWP